MDSLKDLASALAADPDVQLAVLFGSAARGAPHRRSDLDIGVMGLRSTARLAALAMVDWWEWAPLARRFAAAAMARLRSQAGHGARSIGPWRIGCAKASA